METTDVDLSSGLVAEREIPRIGDESSLSEPRTPIAGNNVIVEITTQLLSTDAPRDYCTNTLHYNTGGSLTTATAQALADAIKTVWFANSGTWTRYGTNGGKVIVYDQAAAKPRPELAVSLYTPAGWATSVSLPRQVSLCLSFFCQRNLKRLRGRIYLPVNPNWNAGERPNNLTMTNALAVGTQLKTVTTALVPRWDQTVRSEVLDDSNVVDNWWVNDVWDIQRRRAPKESTRVHSP